MGWEVEASFGRKLNKNCTGWEIGSRVSRNLNENCTAWEVMPIMFENEDKRRPRSYVDVGRKLRPMWAEFLRKKTEKRGPRFRNDLDLYLRFLLSEFASRLEAV